MLNEIALRRSGFSRFALSIGVSMGITIGLFLVMQLAVQSDGEPIEKRNTALPISFVKLPPEIPEPPTKQIKKPPKVEPPPKFELKFAKLENGATASHFEFVAPTPTGKIDVKGGRADGDLLPFLTVQPEYPARAAQRGIEGWVIVEFTVDSLGRVVQPRVIDAQPSNIFNKSAINAVQRYKYKPRVVHGSATTVHGVKQRIVFNLATS